MAFKFNAKYSLKDYGTDFANSYIVLSLLDKNQIFKFNRDIQKLTKKLKETDSDSDLANSEAVFDAMYERITECFVEGSIFEDGAERPMQKADILLFPIKLIQDLSGFIQGTLEKKD